MRLNFFTKLMILVLVLTVSSTGVTGTILLQGMESSLKTNINREIENQVAGLGRNIEAMLQEKIKTGQMIAGHPQVIRGDEAGVRELLDTVKKAEAKDYESIWIVNRDGYIRYVTADGLRMIGVSLADRPFVKEAIQSGKPVIGDVIVSKNSNKPAIVIACPIKDQTGTVIGVVGQVMVLDALETLRSQLKVGITGSAGVSTNSNGRSIAIAHSNQNYVAEQKDVSDIDIIKDAMNGKTQVKGFNALDGVAMIGASYIIPSTKWIVLAMVPEHEVYAEISSNQKKMAGMIGVSILLVILLTWYFADKIAKRLIFMLQRVVKVTEGDLQAHESIDVSHDEIGKLGIALNMMTEKLRELIGEVASAAERVSASSEQLKIGAEQSAQGASQVAAAIGDVANGTEQQTGAVQKATEVVGRMAIEIKQAVTNSTIAETTADQAAGAAEKGGQCITSAVQQMKNIEDKVIHSAQTVIKLGERSKEIGQIVDTISGIAGQTNLLALNAAIEAARAGEHGRGFAVVAEEVRGLAEQSQEAAKQIAALIREIQSDTDNAVIAMNEGSHEVKTGTEVIQVAGESFGEIVTLVEQVGLQVKHISLAIQVIASGSQDIVTAVQAIDVVNKDTVNQTHVVSAVTQEQAASMEQIAASSVSLAQMAQELQRIVVKFKI